MFIVVEQMNIRSERKMISIENTIARIIERSTSRKRNGRKELSKCKWRKHTYVRRAETNDLRPLTCRMCVHFRQRRNWEREMMMMSKWTEKINPNPSIFFLLLLLSSFNNNKHLSTRAYSLNLPNSIRFRQNKVPHLSFYYSTVNTTIYRVIATIIWWYLKFFQSTRKINR